MPSARRLRIVSQALRRAPGIEAGRRLVEEDQLRVSDQAEPEVEAALLAAGERAHAGVALLREADDLDHLLRVAWRRVVAGEHAEALADGERRVEGRGLEHDADALAPARLACCGSTPSTSTAPPSRVR